MRANCIDEIQFDKLYVRFNLPHYNQYCLIEDKERLKFAPNEIFSFAFKFVPSQEDVGKELEVSSISLELGNRDVRVLVMHWRSDCKNALSYENHTINTISRMGSLFLDTKKLSSSNLCSISWNDISVVPITR
jgi:hypothetical protein